MDQLEKNKTLRCILATLLAIGNFLNSTDVSTLAGRANGFEGDVCFLTHCVFFSLPLISIQRSHSSPPPAPLPTYLFVEVKSGIPLCTGMCYRHTLSFS